MTCRLSHEATTTAKDKKAKKNIRLSRKNRQITKFGKNEKNHTKMLSHQNEKSEVIEDELSKQLVENEFIILLSLIPGISSKPDISEVRIKLYNSKKDIVLLISI